MYSITRCDLKNGMDTLQHHLQVFHQLGKGLWLHLVSIQVMQWSQQRISPCIGFEQTQPRLEIPQESRRVPEKDNIADQAETQDHPLADQLPNMTYARMNEDVPLDERPSSND